MDFKQILAAFAFAFVAIIVLALLFGSPSEEVQQLRVGAFDILEIGRAGDFGYVIVKYQGKADVTLISFDEAPQRKITILNESEGLGAKQFVDFTNDLSLLEKYGFDIKTSNARVLGDGIFVIATGALPSYVFDDLYHNATNATVVYVGRTDLIIDNGVKKEDWYSRLDPNQQKRIQVFNSSPEEFIETNSSLAEYILENVWIAKNKSRYILNDSGKSTLTTPIGENGFLRVVYSIPGKNGAIDTTNLGQFGSVIKGNPESIFPWEKASLEFSLEKTNGTAFLTKWKNGVEVGQPELLGRVSDENIFPMRLSFGEPGDYILKVVDNSGTIASGIMHVKDLQVTNMGATGFLYQFNVTVDGKPINNVPAKVHLANSSMSKDYYVSDGVLSIPAQLQRGKNVFVINLLGTTKQMEVDYSQEGITDIYLKYGLPGLLIVALVYFGARMTRRPVYVLRVGELAGEIRKDVKFSSSKTVVIIASIREELGIGKVPISAHEFGLGLKRHVTEGADVTEGNVEDILQRLVKNKVLESYRQFYQLKGEGEVKRNALSRMIRDKLIESGVDFSIKGKRFLTRNAEIGFYGDKFSGKAIVIVEDPQEVRVIRESLNNLELSSLEIKLANGVLKFVPIDRLPEVL